MSFLFFYNAPAPTEIYTLSLHDALPIFAADANDGIVRAQTGNFGRRARHHRYDLELILHQLDRDADAAIPRSEEHTSELQSRLHLVCRLLLEKKKKNIISTHLS